MIRPAEIAARYDPGEAVGPLLRALVGGALGIVAALAVDTVMRPGFGPIYLWAVLSPSVARQVTGLAPEVAAALLTVGVALAFIYVYSQMRRFLPRRSVAAGMVYGLALWTLCFPLFALRSAELMGILAPLESVDTAIVLRTAAWLVLESLACFAVYGGILGAVNPRRGP